MSSRCCRAASSWRKRRTTRRSHAAPSRTSSVMSGCCSAAEARHDATGNCGGAPRTLISHHHPPRRQMMPQMIFVNLPVADLDKSKAFYEAVGAVNNPAFTDETAACMVVEEGSIHVMLQIGRASCRERVCQYV